jgi:hypothetical protein
VFKSRYPDVKKKIKKAQEIRKAVKELREDLKEHIPLADTCPQCDGNSAGYTTKGKPFSCRAARGGEGKESEMKDQCNNCGAKKPNNGMCPKCGA